MMIMLALLCAVTVSATNTMKLVPNIDGTGEGFEVTPGGTFIGYIYFNMDESFAGSQFDLYLPDGITIQKAVASDLLKDEEGEVTHSWSKSTLSNGATRFLVYSAVNTPFAAQDGPMFKITFNVAADFQQGQGHIATCILARKNATKEYPEDYYFNISKTVAKATSVTLDRSSALMNIGETITLAASILPAEASQNVTWKSSNTSVATVSNGVVTAKASGSAKITATTTDGTGLTATCDIIVIGSNMPDTDISGYSNIMYVNNQDLYTGSTAVIPINLKNSAYIVGFQCDVVLPEGVSLAKDGDEYKIELADSRTTYKKHSLSYKVMSDGSIRLVCVSLNNYYFSGNDGAVVYMTVNVAKGLPEGKYPLFVNNIETTTATGTLYDVDICKSSLNIIERIMGDVNKDKKVSVADAACAVSIILGTELPSWDKPAADINEDGSVTVTDVASMVNMILNASSSAKADEFINYSNPEISLSQDGNMLGVNVVGNVNEYTGIQFDIQTEGDIEDILSTVRSENHLIAVKHIDGNLYRVVAYSIANNAFAGISGDVVKLVFSESNCGNCNVEINNIELVRTDLSTAYADSQNLTMTFAPTGIDTIENGQINNNQEMYNLNGVRVNSKFKGVVILNGKKTIVK